MKIHRLGFKTSIVFLAILFICFPTKFMFLKAILILLYIFLGMFLTIKNGEKIILYKNILICFILYIFSGLFAIVISIIKGNSAFQQFVFVDLIAPLIYIFLIAVLKKYHLADILLAIEIATFFTLFYDLAFFLCLNIPFLLILEKMFIYIYPNYGGYLPGFTKITTDNISYLLFLIPFFMCRVKQEKKKNVKNRYIAIAALGFCVAIVSLRTAYILILVLAPFLIVFYNIKENIFFTKRFVYNLLFCLMSFVTVLCIAYLFGFIYPYKGWNILNSVVQKIHISFQNEAITNTYGIVDEGGKIRYEQLRDLLKSWSYSPVLGLGEGASVYNPEAIRMGSSYELSYFAMLMQRGLVGFSFFASGIIKQYKICFFAIKNKNFEERKILSAVLTGVTTFLIANATNPYLMSFDRLFILFFSLFFMKKFYDYES